MDGHISSYGIFTELICGITSDFELWTVRFRAKEYFSNLFMELRQISSYGPSDFVSRNMFRVDLVSYVRFRVVECQSLFIKGLSN